GQFIPAGDFATGLVRFVPVNATGTTSFTFQVQDNGGTANSGVDTDQSPNTLTINVTGVNHAPAGSDRGVTTLEDKTFTFAATDFPLTDADGNTLLAVKVTTVPA